MRHVARATADAGSGGEAGLVRQDDDGVVFEPSAGPGGFAVAPLAANPLPGQGDGGVGGGSGLLRAAKLTVPEAAAMLGIGETKMREIIRHGDIPVVRIMGKVLLLERDLEAYLLGHYGALKKPGRQAAGDRLPALPNSVVKSVLLKRAS